MDQSSIDALLAQVQTQTEQLNKEAGGGTAATKTDDPLAAQIAEVLGEMEPPGAAHAGTDGGLAGEFSPPPIAGADASGEIRRLMSIEVPLIVRLGQRHMTVGEVMRLSVGAIVEFNKSADEEMEMLVNNKPVGKGHAVKVGENFGIKITYMGPLRDTIRKLGGR